MSAQWKLEAKREALETRACVLHAARAFFLSRDYLEVETPNRIPVPLPESHIDALPAHPWWLHPSPELCMKRMLAAGYGRIFQISKCYRGAERGPRHLPEFTLLEWYRAGCDYRLLMEDCEDLFLYLSGAMGIGDRLTYRGRPIDLSKPWERLSVQEAFDRYGSASLERALEQDRFEEILALEIEPRLGDGKPTLLYDYPLAFASLARASKDKPAFAERFEIYIGGAGAGKRVLGAHRRGGAAPALRKGKRDPPEEGPDALAHAGEIPGGDLPHARVSRDCPGGGPDGDALCRCRLHR